MTELFSNHTINKLYSVPVVTQAINSQCVGKKVSAGANLSLSAVKMTLRSRRRDANTRRSRRRLKEEKRHSKSTCSRRESEGRHNSITCGRTVTRRVCIEDRSVVERRGRIRRGAGGTDFFRTSVPEPGRKFLTVMVLPGAGKGASMIPLMKGCTRAGEMALLFSTSSRIWKQGLTLQQHKV